MHRNIDSERSYSLTKQLGYFRIVVLGSFVLLIGIIFMSKFLENHVSAEGPTISSVMSNYCLDDHGNSMVANAEVVSWKCNNSAAQVWEVRGSTIIHDNNCLSVQDNGKAEGNKVVLNVCNNDPGQVWLRDKVGFENPNSNMCLSTSTQKPEQQLFLASCNKLFQPNEGWLPESLTRNNDPACNDGPEGKKIACNAEKEWTTWQSSSQNHTALLTKYTDGAPYEEWCADFVSFVYKESGRPFSGGEADGWDESDANNIQNMGFTKHVATSGYIPQTGDVAYFDYQNGHVEIVVSGGKTPTFIYGNSAIIDPTTGNGQMVANTITSDSSGQVEYYLSPN